MIKLYKTSQFRDIQIQECEYINDGFFYVKAKNLIPKYSNTERLVQREMRGSQNNYFLTEIEAKNFVLTQLSDKIKQMELEIEKYKLIAEKFSKGH